MEHLKIINKSDMKIILRKDFYSIFHDIKKSLFGEAGIKYYCHNLIKDYGTANHVVSSFGSNEEWSETYWQNFWNSDPMEKSCHKITLSSGIGLTSWQLIDPTSDCAETRIRMCDVKDGVLIAFNHKNNIIENVSFGWKDLGDDTLNSEKITILNKIMRPLREYHLNHLEEYS